jgi:hypothetical protein
MMGLVAGTTTMVGAAITVARGASIRKDKAQTEKAPSGKVKAKLVRGQINEDQLGQVLHASRCEPVVSFKIVSALLCTTITATNSEPGVARQA